MGFPHWLSPAQTDNVVEGLLQIRLKTMEEIPNKQTTKQTYRKLKL